MNELNREQIIKALECCNVINGCKDCPYSHNGKPTDNGECGEKMSSDVLALIKSQEQKNKELTEDVEKYIAQTKELAVELDAMRGAANSYKMHNEKLTEEKERLRAESDELRDTICCLEIDVENAKADTMRKMAERLTSFFSDDDMLRYTEVDDEYINAQIMKITEYMLREDGK